MTPLRRPAVRYHSIGVTIAVLLLVIVNPNPVQSNTTEMRAQEFVRSGINKVLVILKDRSASPATKLDRLRVTFREYFDHRFIGRYAAGIYIRRANPEQRRRYLTVLEDYVVNVYGRSMLAYSDQIDLKLKASDIFKITGAGRVGRSDIVVFSHINRRGAEAVTFRWRLRKRENGFRIIDVIILGVSQVLVYRQEFTAVIRRRGKGLAGLTAALAEKNAQLSNSK